MIGRRASLLYPSLAVLVLTCTSVFTQSPTTGRLMGTVKDPAGAVVPGATVTITKDGSSGEQKFKTNSEGNYYASSLPPGAYSVNVTANGFAPCALGLVQVHITETTVLNAKLEVQLTIDPVTAHTESLIQSGGPQLGRVIDSHAVGELPTATLNYTQFLALSPGTNVALPNSTALGRNSQNVSVNGARVMQNNFEINGVDANKLDTNAATDVAVPAPETIQEFKVQTSLYDATFGRGAGGNVQAVTRSGSNNFHGAGYEYFRNDALNANNPFLKFAGVKRPALLRNAFGGLLGGPIKTNKLFFFISYQATRERNGASPNSLTSDVLVAEGLTDDRSEQTLVKLLNSKGVSATSINPEALAVLNTKLPDGQFLIPTPQADGHYSNSAISAYREDQFNTNVDYRINQKNWLAVKFFFSNAPQFLALLGQANVPGFGYDRRQNNRVLSVQDIHTLNAHAVNEARAGYSFIRDDIIGRNPVNDSDVGITRSNADIFPGLPLIRIGPQATNSVTIGNSGNNDVRIAESSATFVDILSLSRGQHSIRTGAEVINYRTNLTTNNFRRGQIVFSNFNEFLLGKVNNSTLGEGINNRILRATDYSVFLQDDWRFSKGLVLNLGLRYELDMPPYDTRGVLSAFDPSLYQPRPLSDTQFTGLLVPLAGFVQAGNVIPQYDLPGVPNVGKRVLTSVDGDNFAPRIGFAYSPLGSERLVVRGGYGIFYSRLSAAYLGLTINTPPTFAISRKQPTLIEPLLLANPFAQLPSQYRFPIFVRGVTLAGNTLNRNIRTPYFQQYNASVQQLMSKDVLLEVAYVGTRGLNLLRNIGINQARLASVQNTSANASFRAPYQGVDIATFEQIQSTAQSTYSSLQVSLTKRLAKGLEFLAAYTCSRSIDNSSGGINSAGENFETASIRGNQLDNRANRGLSDFDRTHRFVLNYLWDLPRPAFAAGSTAGRLLFGHWQMTGIITAMSGLPIDIVDANAGSLYGLSGGGLNNTLARPNWAPGQSATKNIPAGYFFNPFAFERPFIGANQAIPSSILNSNGAALADLACGTKTSCTDIGNVGRNVLRGSGQNNVDVSIIKRFPIRKSKDLEFRAEFFNLFNHVNFANPISNFNAVPANTANGEPNINSTSGQIISDPGDFGRITATSNNPRLIQFAVKFNF